jgi:NADPH:quinone reductase
LKLEEVPIPTPGKGQVLIEVKAIGVNPVDTYLRTGAYANAKLPYIPGFDASGVVAVAGEGSSWRTGQRIYTASSVTGTYAEYAVCEEETLHPLPEQCSFAQGAALGVPYATAYQALFHRARAAAGETVLVHGASGGVGTAAVQWARAAGLTVIGTAGTDKGRALVAENGAHHVLDHGTPNYATKILQLTGGRGVDLVVEMLANVNLATDLTLLAKFGRVVVVGNRGKIEINPREAMARDATILGMTLFNATPEQLRAIHAAIYAGLENGTLRPVIGQELPLREAPRAHTAVLEPGAYGKIVLVP